MDLYEFKEDSNADLFLCIWISSFGHHRYICSGDNKTERIKEKRKKRQNSCIKIDFDIFIYIDDILETFSYRLQTDN